VEVLSSRVLLRPADLGRSRHFYRDVLGLAIYREFGPPADPAMAFFPGPGFLEVSGHTGGAAGQSVMIWLQVRDIAAEHDRLATSGVRIVREPVTEPWGLTEMWLEDPDGVRIVLAEVPAHRAAKRPVAMVVADADGLMLLEPGSPEADRPRRCHRGRQLAGSHRAPGLPGPALGWFPGRHGQRNCPL
jgi:predicted enzyme related to lactoylglutathione lyase